MILTHDAPAEVAKAFPMLPVAFFRSSFFLGYLGQLLYSPDIVNLPLVTNIHLHPFAVRTSSAAVVVVVVAVVVGVVRGIAVVTCTCFKLPHS